MTKTWLFVGVALLAACKPSPYQLTQAETLMTEAGARDYAERIQAKYVSCSGQDSDGDKYVTCTIADQTGKTSELLCAYNSRGCKQK